MNNPLVSIVCTNYNKGDWIGEAIESFLAQKVDFDYEILLIDDASTDHSPDIIKTYAKNYPDTIRAFYNKKNLGITKTWIKICKEAKGKYIARCDGDDYWTNPLKLQKQVNALEENKKSKWCSTDYDIISPGGDIIHKSSYKNYIVKRPKNYAEMLATKGFTMASTWLVLTKLMQEVNAEIDPSAVDDTFNIQLDLFNKTELTYLPESMVVHRISEGTDSSPARLSDIKKRYNKLLKTQLEYINKYKNTDYKNIIEALLKHSMVLELLAIERQLAVKRQQKVEDDYIKEIKKRDKIIEDLLSSRSYRVGKAIAYPVKIMKSKISRK